MAARTLVMPDPLCAYLASDPETDPLARAVGTAIIILDKELWASEKRRAMMLWLTRH
jgi:hypothetical protein